MLDCRGNAIAGDGSGWAITLENVSGVTIRNCVLQNFRQGLRLNYSGGNILSGNNATSCSEAGFYLFHSHSNNLTDSNVSGSGNGIHLRYSDGNSIMNNTASGNSAGILVQNSNGSILNDNTADSNGDGIYISGPGSTTLSRNRACSNTLGNVTCSSAQSDGGGNTCTESGCGIACGPCP